MDAPEDGCSADMRMMAPSHPACLQSAELQLSKVGQQAPLWKRWKSNHDQST